MKRAYHPLIGDTMAIIVKELGIERAAALCAQATVDLLVEAHLGEMSSALRLPLPRPILEDETTYGLWSGLWSSFRNASPACFRIEEGLPECDSSPAALAYCYARANGSIGISPFRPTLEENLLVGRARAFLAYWTGVRQFLDPALAFAFNERCLPLRALRTIDGWIGMSFAEDRQLREHVIIDSRYVESRRGYADGATEIASLLLHEEIHSTLAVREGTPPPKMSQELTAAVSEGGTSLLELAAVFAASDRGSSLDCLKVDHGYQQQIAATAKLFGKGLALPELARATYDLLVAVLRSGNDYSTAAWLNEAAGLNLSVDRWLDRFGSLT